MSKGTNQDKIVRAAKEVQEAHIRVFRADRAQVPPSGVTGTECIAQIDAKIKQWEAKPIEEFLEHYKKRV
jgi:hypothetical protein